jgi:transposase-like protein
MAKKKPVRVLTRAFKLSALNRMAAGENVCALARELKIRRKLLYEWRDQLRAGGPAGLRSPGRPRKVALAEIAASGEMAPPGELAAARARIAELERKVGQQQLDLDFFKRALRQVKASRQLSDGPGATASTHSSKR